MMKKKVFSLKEPGRIQTITQHVKDSAQPVTDKDKDLLESFDDRQGADEITAEDLNKFLFFNNILRCTRL